MKNIYKHMASRMPLRWQKELKRLYYGRQIKQGRFVTNEKEFDLLAHWVGQGDRVLDVGANIGHYTCKLAHIVGPSGRVFAFEPVSQTFEILASNTALISCNNITLFNMAASESNAIIGMEIPKFDTGLDNYYQAHLVNESSGMQVYCMAIDNLGLPGPIKLVKIDAEGHELSVIKGMNDLLVRDDPVLIVEDNSPEVISYLKNLNYSPEKIDGSCNIIFVR